MKITEELVRRIQKESLEEYCMLLGISVKQFCNKKYEDGQYLKKICESKSDKVSSVLSKYLFLPKNPSIKDILDHDYALSESYRKGCVEIIKAFFKNEFYTRTLLINIELLKSCAAQLDIEIKSNSWLSQYLNEIPLVVLYSPNVEAYVQKLPKDYPKIIISNSLINVFENGIVPVLINQIFKVKKGNSDTLRNFLSSNNSPSNGLESTADSIIDMTKYYFDPKTNFIDFIKTKRSEAVSLFGMPFSLGFTIFTILHEYAHVIYSHFTKKSEVIDEVFADNLAVYLLIEHVRRELNALNPNSERLMLTNFKVYSFMLLAPLVLMHFFNIAKIITNDINSESHLHPAIREWHIKNSIWKYFENKPQFIEILDESYNLVNGVFEFIYKKLGKKDRGINTQDLAMTQAIQLPLLYIL